MYSDGTEIRFDEDCQLISSTDNLTPEELKIFPNPVSSFLDISELPDFQRIRIYNSVGKLIEEFDNSQSKVDCSQLPKGFYTLILILEKNRSLSTKFIKK